MKEKGEDGYNIVAYLFPGQGDKKLCRSAVRLVKIDGRAAVYSTVAEALRDEHLMISLSAQRKRPIWLCVLSSAKRLVELTANGRTSGRKKADSVSHRD